MSSFPIKEARKLFQQHDFEGDSERIITRAIGIGDSMQANFPDAVTWINDTMSHQVEPHRINVGLLILSKTAFQNLKSAQANFLIVDNPRGVFFKIIENFFKTSRIPKIEPTAIIHETVALGENCYIGHHVVIEKNCKIGSNTTILHNTSILEGTVIGEEVTIGCNNTIGNYGFGYEKNADGTYFALQHLGHVVIHDRVEIHNNTCIDRGVLGATEIHENAKIDNLVHIAHGVVIGQNSLVIANAMVAGSAVIGENSWIAPSVSIKNKITIAPGTMTGIGAVILKDTVSHFTYIGNPATTLEDYKNWSTLKKKITEENRPK